MNEYKITQAIYECFGEEFINNLRDNKHVRNDQSLLVERAALYNAVRLRLRHVGLTGLNRTVKLILSGSLKSHLEESVSHFSSLDTTKDKFTELSTKYYLMISERLRDNTFDYYKKEVELLKEFIEQKGLKEEYEQIKHYKRD